jgi:hypothetical protein
MEQAATLFAPQDSLNITKDAFLATPIVKLASALYRTSVLHAF